MVNKQKIGLGTVQFGTDYGISNKKGQTSPTEITEILETARKHRVNVLDTASAYGSAEKVLGEHDLSEFQVVSKFLPPNDGSSVADQFELSLGDLKVSSLFGYLAHRPLHLAQNREIWDELLKLKRAGKVNKIGYSLNSPAELKQLLDKGMQPDLVQVPFNYFDRRFADVIKELKSSGCEVHTRSAFLQGLFFTNTDQLPAFFDPIKSVINELHTGVQNLPSKLLNFVLKQPFIDQVIIGVENNDQFLENLKAEEDTGTLPELENEIAEQILMPSNWPDRL